MPNKELNDKFKEVKDQLREEVRGELMLETFDNLKGAIVEDVINRSGKLIENALDGFHDKIVKVLSEKIEKLTIDNAQLKEELVEVKHENSRLTTLVNEATQQVEHLSGELNGVSNKKLQEVETYEKQNALLETELMKKDIRLQVFEILDTNIPLRSISDRLFACKSIQELNTIVEVFDSSIKNEAFKTEKILESIKGKGRPFIEEDYEATPKLTEEQKEQRVLAGYTADIQLE